MTSREFWILVLMMLSSALTGCSRETQFSPQEGGDEQAAGPQIVRVATVDWPGAEGLAGAGGLEELEQLAGAGGLEELEQLAGAGGLEELEQLAGAGGLEELEQLAGAGGLEELAGPPYPCGLRCEQPGGVCRPVASDVPGGCETLTSHLCIGTDATEPDAEWGALRCCEASGFPDVC